MFIGYSVGSAPLISYNFGAKNTDELKNLFRKSTAICFVAGAAMTVSSLLLSVPLSTLFAGYDEGLYKMTLYGLRIFSFSFFMSGFCIFGSSFFTALNNGLISAVISFLRTLVFQIAAVLLLPLIWGVDGIWASIIVAEFLAAVLTVVLIFAYRKRYGYL